MVCDERVGLILGTATDCLVPRSTRTCVVPVRAQDLEMAMQLPGFTKEQALTYTHTRIKELEMQIQLPDDDLYL